MDRSYATRAARRKIELDEAVATILSACRAFEDIEAVYAFGSYARGTIAPTSDLDLFVVRDTTMRHALRDRDIRLAYSGGVPLDIVVVTPSEFRDALPTTGMGQTILRDARRIDAA